MCHSAAVSRSGCWREPHCQQCISWDGSYSPNISPCFPCNPAQVARMEVLDEAALAAVNK